MALTNVWLVGYGGPPPAASGATAVWLAPNDGTVPAATLVTLVGWEGPVTGATPIWIAGYGGPPPAAIGAIPICISGWSGSGGGGGGGTTASVWSAADATANGMTLSNGGLTVTPNGPASWKSIRSSIGKTSGKLYAEFAVSGSVDAGTNMLIGLASSGFNAGDYLGSSNYSEGLRPSISTYVSVGFTAVGGGNPNVSPPVTGDVWALAVDFTAGNIWVARNNVWGVGLGKPANDPGTGTSPVVSFVPATVGALFAAMTFQGNPGVWTLQSTAASQKYAPPSGFSAWDGGVAPPPMSVWSAADAAANGMALSNGGLTVTPSGALDLSRPAEPKAVWQSIRTSTSKTAGKLYVELGTSAAITNFLWALGFANASFPINTYLGSAAYSCGILLSVETDVSSGFTSNYTSGLGNLPAAGAVYSLAVDFTAGSIWVALNNVWSNGSNPATGTLPIVSFVPATVGALFAGMSYQGVNNGVWTLQATAASQKYAPPSGFSAWG